MKILKKAVYGLICEVRVVSRGKRIWLGLRWKKIINS
jgi:hypothetical protein